MLRDLREATVEERGGEVVLRSGDHTGRVFFVKGRIAWATASTVKRTFIAHLVEQAALSREALQEVFESCRVAGANFGETLVERGLLDEARLRELLLQHLSDCLLEAFRWPSPSSMFVPEERPYKGSLTFDLREVLQQVLALDTEGRLPFAGHSVDELLAAAQDAAQEAAQGAAQEEAAPPAPPPRAARARPGRGVRWLIVAGAALGLAAVGAGAWTYVRRADRSADTALPPARPDAVPVAERAPDGMTRAVADAGATAPKADAAAAASQPASAPAAGEAGEAAIVVGLPGEGRGAVRVLSQPRGARIFLDGVDTRRRAPVTLREISAGVEHVLMIDQPRHAPEYRRFKLAPQMAAVLRFKLRRLTKEELRQRPQRISVRVESLPPGARVRVDRRGLAAQTPTEVRLDPRRAALVELQLAGFRPWQRRIRPVPGVPLTFRATLAPSRKPRRPARPRPRTRRRSR